MLLHRDEHVSEDLLPLDIGGLDGRLEVIRPFVKAIAKPR